MKKLLTLSTITIFSLALTSCKKDDVPKTVVGYWTGTIQQPLNQTASWGWLLRADKTARIYFGSKDSTKATNTFEGTYSTTDSTINLRYDIGSGFYYSLSNGKINSNYTRIEGQDNLGASYFVER